MNTDETVAEDTTEVAEENGSAEPVDNDHPQPDSRKSRFVDLLKAIEHWVQTR